MDIYVVKIRQRRLMNRTYFPFERLYMVPNEFFENDYWKSVFPYMLVVESPLTLIATLEKLDLQEALVLDTDKNPEPDSSWKGPHRRAALGCMMPNLKNHRIVIPTYPYKKKLGYIWSYLKNAKSQGIELSLYTPDKIVPSVCYQCVNLSHKYAGECQLTSDACRGLIKLDLPKRKEDETCQSDSGKRPSHE